LKPGKKEFFSALPIHPASGSHTFSCSERIGVFFRGKTAGAWSWLLHSI